MTNVLTGAERFIAQWRQSTAEGNLYSPDDLTTYILGIGVVPGNGRQVSTLSGYLLNNAVFNVKDYGAKGNGTTDDRANIAAADAAAVAAGGVLTLPPGTYRVGSNLTLSSAAAGFGGVLKPDSGVTVTIAGPVFARPVKMFDFSAGGTISFTGNKTIAEYLPQWFGVVGDKVTDDQPALTKMFASVPDYATIRASCALQMFLGSTLVMSDRNNLQFTSGLSPLNGSSALSLPQFYWGGAAGGTVISMDRCRFCEISGFVFAVNGANICIDADGYTSGHIGTAARINDNAFVNTTKNASFVAVRLSKTVTNNWEYCKIVRNSFQLSPCTPVEGTNGAITSGTTTFTGSGFTVGNVGDPIWIAGAGVAGALLSSTITGFTSSTQVTIADAAGTTVSGSAPWATGAFGVGIEINSSNAKQQIIDHNTFSFGAVGVHQVNGSCSGRDNSFTRCDKDYWIENASEIGVFINDNVEFSRQHAVLGGQNPVTFIGGRLGMFGIKPQSGYIQPQAGSYNVNCLGTGFEGVPTTGATVFDMSAAANCTVHLQGCHAAIGSTLTQALLGVSTNTAGGRLLADSFTNISDLANTDYHGGRALTVTKTDFGVVTVSGTALVPASGGSGGEVYAGVQGTAGAVGAFGTPDISGVRGTLDGHGATDGACIDAVMPTASVRTYTRLYGMRVRSPVVSGGAITTAYGYHLAQVGGAGVTKAWGYFQSGTDTNKLAGPIIFGTPASAPTDADIDNGEVQFYLDEAGNNLKVRVRYSSGTLKTGTVALV